MSPGILPTVHYNEAFSDLAGVYLEESWVLEVVPSDHLLSFRLETVLTPEHAMYAPPKPGRTALLPDAVAERGRRGADGHPPGSHPAVDATEEPDFGHVDAFVFNRTEDRWELEGDRGFAAIRTPAVLLRFD